MQKLSLLTLLFCIAIGVSPALCNAGPLKPRNGTPARNPHHRAPASLSRHVKPLKYVDVIVPDEVNLAAVHSEDRKREQQGGPYRFAVRKPTRIDTATGGTWEQIDPKTMLWRLHVVSPGAASLSLGFTAYNMPPGGRIFIYSADGKQVLGPYTSKNNAAHHQLWTPLILSDDVVVELTIPVDETASLELTLGAINHGYREMPSPRYSTFGLADSGSCEINVACSQGDPWRDQIRSVARYYVSRDDGTFICTGALINNTSGDDVPYFLSAFHCFDEYGDGILADPNGAAASMVVYWNFQASDCNGTTAPEDQTQTGAFFRAANQTTDFCLVELDEKPSEDFGVFYAGWDRSGDAPSSAAAIHHPQGDIKKIAIDYEPLSITSYIGTEVPGDGTHLRVTDWNEGTTEAGSSGCPLFDPAAHIVGQLHGGYAACGNTLSDWFGLLSMSWSGGASSDSRLSDWLDPCGIAPVSLDGKNPVEKCYRIEDFETGDFNSLSWILSGDANLWTITSDDQNSGLYSAKAGVITDFQSTSIQVTLACGSGYIKFLQKVSSEGYDMLTFYIDGNIIERWAGTQDWTRVAYPVTQGVHTFKWTYSKDYSSYVGDDTAWLDDIQFPCDKSITGGLIVDSNWMYQNLPGHTDSNITATLDYIDDPRGNSSYSYYWSFGLPDDVNIEPIMVAGGKSNDACSTFAAEDRSKISGLSDSGQTLKVIVEIIGNDFGNFGIMEKEFAIALLGDVNNDGVVNLVDRLIVNAFWRTGSAGPYTLKDCDLSCDGIVNLVDRSIANLIWLDALGSNSVTVPCPLR